jgi:hypothetical protein
MGLRLAPGRQPKGSDDPSEFFGPLAETAGPDWRYQKWRYLSSYWA